MDLQGKITDLRVEHCKKLREVRKEKKITTTQAANAMGMDTSSLSRYENGKINISLDMLIKFAEYYGCNVSILFESK